MIGADSIGRLAISQEPTAGQVFVLSAATGTFVLTGEAALFDVLMAAAQGAFSLTGEPATALISMPAAQGSFVLTGFNMDISFSAVQQPMKVVRDYWDVDEWGRFIPGGGMRYTL